VREIRTLRAMWRGLETTHGSDTEALSTETESKQSRPNLRSIGASPRPYRAGNGCTELWDSSRSTALPIGSRSRQSLRSNRSHKPCCELCRRHLSW
jgi:hypothetical protein